jgi:hypothetical protein
MAWFDSEQGVEARSGHGSPAKLGLVRATPADPSEVAARWAATSVPAKNKPRQAREIFLFELALNCDKIIKLLELNIKA